LDDVAIAKALNVPIDDVAVLTKNMSPSAKVLLDGVAIQRATDTGLAGKALKAGVEASKFVGAYQVGGPLGLLAVAAGSRAGGRANRLWNLLGFAPQKVKDQVENFATRLYERSDKAIRATQRGLPKAVGPAAVLEGLLLGDTDKKSGETATRTRMRHVVEAAGNPEATRDKIDDNLAPLRAIHPELGYAIADKVNGIYQYLNNLVPASVRNPDYSPSAVSKAASAAEEHIFDLQVAAALTPLLVLSRALLTNKLAPESIRVIADLYPNLLNQIRERLIVRLFSEKKAVPYEKQILMEQILGGTVNKAKNATPVIQTIYQQNQVQQGTPPRGTPSPPEQPTTAQRLAAR
jgi:hypothetical protein